LKLGQATAALRLVHGDKSIELDALVDTGASRSVISRRLAGLGALIPLKELCELRMADEKGG